MIVDLFDFWWAQKRVTNAVIITLINWPYESGNGVITLLIGVIIPLTTGRGPTCMSHHHVAFVQLCFLFVSIVAKII